jgi:hypothetical protein
MVRQNAARLPIKSSLESPFFSQGETMQLKRIAICLALAFAQSAFAAENETMPEVEVKANRLEPLPAPSKSGLDNKGLEQ